MCSFFFSFVRSVPRSLQSLMVLGQVIDALVQKRSHVPFYESKLTMLLQPALGGATRTTVVVTASPDRADAEETLHSLRFGERRGPVAPGGGGRRPATRGDRRAHVLVDGRDPPGARHRV